MRKISNFSCTHLLKDLQLLCVLKTLSARFIAFLKKNLSILNLSNNYVHYMQYIVGGMHIQFKYLILMINYLLI